LQGTKRKPRAHPHPIFGELSRLFVFVDEIENVPGGLHSDLDNLMANLDTKVSGGLKIFGAFNPTNQHDEVGKRAEPEFGWAGFDLDKHFRWKSRRGWDVLRLDGERCENVVEGRIVYPGLQSRAGLEQLAMNAGGTNSAGYFSMGRGAYPPSGLAMTVVPPGMLLKLVAEAVWFNEPDSCGACDLALEGKATALYTLGKFGMASGLKYPPSIDFPKGNTVMFKSKDGKITPRWCCMAEQQFVLPRGDTVKMAAQVIDVSRKAGVKPEYLALDRTGNGAGVADLVKHDWSSAIQDVNYSEGPSETKVMAEDSKTCKEAFDRIHTELWFAFRAWGEFGYLIIHPQMPMEKLSQQLTQRHYSHVGGKRKVESKKDYKSRGYDTPDEADSLTLLIHAVRRGSGLIPSMAGENVEITSDDADEWNQFTGGSRIDPTNRTDTLAEGEELSGADLAWNKIMEVQ
jgi:hypothetical protein